MAANGVYYQAHVFSAECNDNCIIPVGETLYVHVYSRVQYKSTMRMPFLLSTLYVQYCRFAAEGLHILTL